MQKNWSRSERGFAGRTWGPKRIGDLDRRGLWGGLLAIESEEKARTGGRESGAWATPTTVSATGESTVAVMDPSSLPLAFPMRYAICESKRRKVKGKRNGAWWRRRRFVREQCNAMRARWKMERGLRLREWEWRERGRRREENRNGFVVCSYQLLLSESDLTLCSVWTLQKEK